MKKYIVQLFILIPLFSFSQSDFEKTIQAGGVIINGLSFLKGNKPISDNKTVLMLCVKNKLDEKITFKIASLKEENEIKKELVIPMDSKECFLEIPKGIYTYEVLMNNKETFKKGEYKFDEDITITIKKEN